MMTGWIQTLIRVSGPVVGMLLLACAAELARAAEVVSLAVYPAAIQLQTSDDHQSVIVVATYNDGTTRDVTGQSDWTLGNDAMTRRVEHRFFPVADGETTLTVVYEGRQCVVPVVVRDVEADRPISFKLDVMPVFMRAGCNSGSCHGSASGQDGFRLSLFGFDPDGDYQRITRQISTRRINLAVTEDSLLIEKSLGRVPHSGGSRFAENSTYHRTLADWLEAGVPRDPDDVARPESIHIMPAHVLLEGEGTSQQMMVLARYSDGTDRDITNLALFLSNNTTTASVTSAGKVTAHQRGEAFVMARFSTFTVGSQVMVIPAGLDYQRPELVETNYVDRLVHEKLHKLRIVPSGICDDHVFVRRAFLDIAGVLPTPEEAEAFFADTVPDKRSRLVDDLLNRKEFAEMWVMKWAELLQIRSSPTSSKKAMLLYFNWIEARIADNVPFDVIVRDLLSANGGTFTNPATNYYQLEGNTLKVAENVAQVFMGMRLQCAQCHNHPFDRWTMDDYYGFSAFFSQIGRKDAEDPREEIVFNSASGEVKNPVSGQVMEPQFLGGEVPDVAGRDRRRVLAEWLVSPGNPYFARNLANMVWAHFFGVGIVDPVDDVRISNPASNPQLLDMLARNFTEYHYDFKRLVRDICTSRTYQRATQPNATNALDMRNYARGSIRRVRSEVLLDAISQVTETQNKFPGLPLGARAVQIADGSTSTYFLSTFGRARRETVCSCQVKMEPNLSQALHLINGETTNQRIVDGKVVERQLAADVEPRDIVEDLYLRCFSRRPTDAEWVSMESVLSGEPDAVRAQLEDLFWALLNAKEFIFTH